MEDKPTKPTSPEAAGYILGACISSTREAFRGKHISAAIIVFAGAILILGGSCIRHDDTRLFVQFVGCFFATVGLAGWFLSSASK